MSLVNLANTKTRLLGCGAIYIVGQCLSTALAGPAAGMATGVLGGPGGVFAASVLATIVAGVVGNITASELGNKLAQRVGKNADILKNGDLTAAAGEAISRLLQENIAESEEIIVIAERNHLPYAKADFQYLAKKTVAYWLEIDTKTDISTTDLNFSDEELAKIFSADPNQFVEITGLSVQDWQDFLGDFAAKENKTLHPELIAYAAAKLHESFPKAFREVLKQDAATGGRQFAGMQLILHRETLAELQSLGLQNGEVLQRLQALATREQICEVMAKLEVIETLRDELAEVRALLQSYIDINAPSLPLSLQCNTIIEDRVRDFTGRLFVFEAISRFLRDNRKGYFVLEAEPGVGKSAIMAKFVLTMERHCVTHFNSRSDGIIDAKTFLENACTQLIRGFQLKDKYPQLPDNATANGNFLGLLLKEVSAKVAPKKLIFVVDALDEVDWSSQTSGSNVLYLPEDLPPNVYFIVSKRREFLPMPAKHLVFDLMQYSAESLADVKAYLVKRTEKSKSIQSWINHRNLNREEFVDAVAQKSEKKFIYLRYVLDEIETGTYEDVSLKDLPMGLQQYYKKHWGQMMGKDDDPLLEMKVKIIYVLSKAREAVSRGWIAKSVAETDFKVQQVLKKWDSFLRQQPVDGEIRYSIYHNSFREFLAQDETVQSAGIDVEEVKRKGINNRIDGAPL